MAEGPRRIRQALDEALGFTLLRQTEGSAVAELPLTGLAVNSLGQAHGGALVSVADALMANLVGPPLDQEGVQQAVTVDIHAHFLRAARGERLRLEAELLQAGRRIAFCACRVYDGEGRLAAHITGSYALRGGGAGR